MPAVARLDPRTIFSPAEWARLSARSSWRGLALVAHAWGVAALGGAVFAAWPNPLTYLLAVMVIGARQLGLAILMHEAAHRALHPDARVNDFVGEWLCAAPVGASLAAYRPYHLAHHRYTEQPEDPDLALSRPFPTTRASLSRKIVRDLTGQTFIKQRFGPMLARARAGAAPIDAAGWRFLLFNGLLFAGLAAAGLWWAYPALWLVPMATWLPLATRLRNIAEHAVVTAKDDPLTHARTTYAGPLERLLIAPYWVHYHAEHHAFMHLPCWRLEEAHRLLAAKGRTAEMEIKRGYRAVLAAAAPR